MSTTEETPKEKVISNELVSRNHDHEMAVFTNAKRLGEYIFLITDKAPKKFRWSIVSRLQNGTIDLVDHLYQANFESGERRIFYQNRAKVQLHLIDHLAHSAYKLQAISQHQMRVIAGQLNEIFKLLQGWIKSTKLR